MEGQLVISGTTLAIFAAIIAALIMLYGMFILQKYVRIVIDVMDNQAFVPDNGNGEGGLSLHGDDVHFQAADGLSLCGTFWRSTGAERERWRHPGTIIFAHEFASDRFAAIRYCLPLVRRGFDVFAFDFRGHGASPAQPGYRPRPWPSGAETADMRGAIAFVASHLREKGRPVCIGLFGLSRGAGTAILAAANNPQVQAIVADGAYSSDATTEYFMRRFATIFAKVRFVAESHPPAFWRLLRWLLFREYHRRYGCRFPSVRKTLAQMRRMPIFFIHGEKDSYIPVDQCQSLYDAAHGPKSLWIVPNARHNQCLKSDPEGYARRVAGFFEEHLLLDPRPAPAPPARHRREEPVLAPPTPSLVPNLVTSTRNSPAGAVTTA